MPISQVSVDGSTGSPQMVEYIRAQRDVVKLYANALGRYPDPAAMKEQVRMRMMIMGMMIVKKVKLSSAFKHYS